MTDPEALIEAHKQVDQRRASDNMGSTILGNRLQSYRKLAGLKLREVAHFTGISLSFLSDIEHGRTVPSIATAKKLARFYNVSLDVMLADIGDDESPNE